MQRDCWHMDLTKHVVEKSKVDAHTLKLNGTSLVVEWVRLPFSWMYIDTLGWEWSKEVNRIESGRSSTFELHILMIGSFEALSLLQIL